METIKRSTERKFGYYNRKTDEWLLMNSLINRNDVTAFPVDFSDDVLYCARNIIEEDFDKHSQNKLNKIKKEDWELVEVEVIYEYETHGRTN